MTHTVGHLHRAVDRIIRRYELDASANGRYDYSLTDIPDYAWNSLPNYRAQFGHPQFRVTIMYPPIPCDDGGCDWNGHPDRIVIADTLEAALALIADDARGYMNSDDLPDYSVQNTLTGEYL